MGSAYYDYRERKIVAVLTTGIEAPIALNVIGHLSIAIGAFKDEHLMGQRTIEDGSGIPHMGISRYPFIITHAKQGKLRMAIEKARSINGVYLADYPRQMLTTGHEEELIAEMKLLKEEEIEYLGAIFYGPTEEINTITGKFSLWK
ncbi:DUF2000 domain-containing protein [Paenibacillus zanthoxyli]|uniref:DUF2000 domain-containing protein n=1 Tax=Paenibacillus zanthoxyli TaxID=369399 RepID=UPI00046FCBB1|nr:DUF2000 domain-containing protein [Paenibacillus zanthoxyli]